MTFWFMFDDDSDESFDDPFYPYLFPHAYDSEEEISDLEELKNLRKKFNWDIEKERHEFFLEFSSLISDWDYQLPNLCDFFRKEEIDWLLLEDVKYPSSGEGLSRYVIISFVIKTGYKDEPKIDEDGKPILHQTTAIHHKAKVWSLDWNIVIKELFKIYDRFDVNYTDESGYSHFHAACRYFFQDNVEKFLKVGQDPNCLWQETGDSPLHVAVTSGDHDITGMLLRGGADPNLANNDGLTPLHVICSRDEDKHMAELFFKISDEVNQPVKVDARDNLGRTPLQLAVAHFMPRVLDVVLDNGADVSSFVYPSESYLGDRWVMGNDRCNDFMVHLAYDALTILQRLKERGYELDRRAALTIMEFFAKHHLFKSPVDLDECWYDDEQFAMQAKEYEVSPSLSFYDLVRLRPEKANKVFTYDMFDDYYEETFWKLSEKCDEALNAHLGEIIMRGFCRRWALNPFLELTHYRLPILCCEIIFENLMNKDLFNIFLTADDQSS